ncbi:MAG: sugar ABC transporter ATP-binding protein [Actinobacteria bacterium]|nr:sugar ABC transporter ATP-binding protein [Actinomycetota bacterium]
MSTDVAGVRITGLRKRYGDTVALAGLDLVARPGEILVDGEPWSSDFGSDRVAVVHQETLLFPNLTVGENVVAGWENDGWRWPRAGDEHHALFDELGILRLRNVPLGELGLAVQQRTEMARALVRDARVMLFDEPNSALTPDESREFFRLAHQLADAGRVVMLISHRLQELATHSDRVAVIMDGRCVRVIEGADKTAETIAETLVRGLGTSAAADAEPVVRNGRTSGESTLELVRVTDTRRLFRDLDFSVPKGHVTALIGVEGSGGREILRACAGLRRVHGTVRVNGRAVRQAQLGSYVSYVAADRASSLFSNLSVGENLVIRLDREISRGAFGLRTRRMASLAEELRREFHVKSDGIDIGIRSLSGGNQQKVAIAAAVGAKPAVLALEEPTRGVDISSKAEIYEILRRFVADGGAVVLFCTEIPEVYEVADQLHVVYDGRLSQPLAVADFADMEALAKAVASLETHGSVAPAA